MKSMTHQAFRLVGLAPGTLTPALPLATLAPTDAVAAQPGSVPPPKSVVAQDLPDVQTTETASQPSIMTDLADLEGGDFAVPVGSFSVPAETARVLDGASADLQGASDTDRMAQLRLSLTFPGETAPVKVATDLGPVTISLHNGGFTGTAVSLALPPMHLPLGTEVDVAALQNSAVGTCDYRGVVTGA